MTELELRNKVVSIINGWIGSRKGGSGHREILEIYNGHKPLARSYKLKATDDYCAGTVSAAYIKAGIAEYTGTEVGVERFAEAAQKKGIWIEADNYVPKIGDAVCYDWQDSGAGDNTGWADHIGIVTAVGKTNFTVTEGNMNGGVVGTRTLQLNGRYIRGFIAPDFATIARALSGESISYRDDVQKRFGFDNNTMAFLDKHPYVEALYQKLATKG